MRFALAYFLFRSFRTLTLLSRLLFPCNGRSNNDISNLSSVYKNTRLYRTIELDFPLLWWCLKYFPSIHMHYRYVHLLFINRIHWNASVQPLSSSVMSPTPLELWSTFRIGETLKSLFPYYYNFYFALFVASFPTQTFVQQQRTKRSRRKNAVTKIMLFDA